MLFRSVCSFINDTDTGTKIVYLILILLPIPDTDTNTGTLDTDYGNKTWYLIPDLKQLYSPQCGLLYPGITLELWISL